MVAARRAAATAAAIVNDLARESSSSGVAPPAVMAARRSLLDFKQNSTPLVVTGLFQGYLAYNLARKALAVAAPGLQADEGLSKTDLGLVSSSFTAMYGASKFAGSVITDHVSTRAMFAAGLVLTGVLCFIFSVSTDLPRLCLLWSLHGVVQGAGWPSLAKICVDRVPPYAQGRVWALLSAAGNAGHVCAGPMLLALGGGWRRIMRGAGAVSLIAGFLAWTLTGSGDDTDEWFLFKKKEGEESREVLLPWTTYHDWRAFVAKTVEWIWVVRRVLSPEVAALFMADSLIYFVIKGLADWSVLSLTETKGLAEKEAVGVFFYCELGAILGSFASGWVSDQVGGLRTSTSSAFALAALPFLYATHKMPLPGLAPLAAAYFMLGLFINGPKTLSGIALRQLVPPSMAGTAMGVQGLVGQVGASWAGAPVGFVAQHWGWGAIRHMWAASLLASAGFLSVPGLLVQARRAAEKHRGREGPLLKLFNYYMPSEHSFAADSAHAAAAPTTAAAASSTTSSAGAAGTAKPAEQGGEQQQQQQPSSAETAVPRVAREGLTRRRGKVGGEADKAKEGPAAGQEKEEGSGEGSHEGSGEEEEDSLSPPLTFRERITRRAQRMRRRLRRRRAAW